MKEIPRKHKNSVKNKFYYYLLTKKNSPFFSVHKIQNKCKQLNYYIKSKTLGLDQKQNPNISCCTLKQSKCFNLNVQKILINRQFTRLEQKLHII